MLSLSHFPSPPPENKVTACESDGQLRAFSAPEAKVYVNELLGNYNVEVCVGQESARSAYSKYEAKETFTTHTETMWQRIIASYYEEGILNAIRQLSVEDGAIPVAKKLADFLLKIAESLSRARHLVQARSREPSTLDVSSVVQASSRSLVSLSWHPHTTTLAVAFADDCVRIYSRGRPLNPVLKHRLQKNITHVQWMPFCASLLGVGCDSGVLVWSLDPVSTVTRPSGSCLSKLSHPDATPVSSFSWHPKGMRFACVGGRGRSLTVWDVGTEESCAVFTGLATSFTHVKYSPSGYRLLAAMSNSALKIFECENWTHERWSLSYPLQSAVWSSCGRHLLFATTKEPLLFCLSFRDEEGGVGGPLVATQMADLSAMMTTCEDGTEISVGGLVRDLAWDAKSERLAVAFKDSRPIALFHTFTKPTLQLAPGGFIKGPSGKFPKKIVFQNNIKNGAVLTTVWSGGEVEHLPLQYTSHEVHTPVAMSPFHRSSIAANAYSTPTTLNHSRMLNMSLGPTSPIGSPLPRLFTSP